jgi:hypothetical protein
MAIGR